MSYLVANMQKLKADNLVGLGNHDQRRTQHHKNADIDVSRSALNYDLVAGRTSHFKTDIEAYVNEHKTSQRAVRKDAVLVNEWIISSDNHFFAHLTAADTRKYFETAKNYFAEKFGEENVRYAIVHLDESTPHMHIGIVPFDDEYKLSAKRVFNRTALQAIQEQLPTYLQQHGFNIQRGVQESERKSLTVPEYKAMREDLKKVAIEKEKIQSELEDTRKRLTELQPRDQQEIESKSTFLSKDKVVVRKSDLHDLESRAAVSDVYNRQQSRLEIDNQSLRNQLIEAQGNQYELNKKNEKLQKLVTTLQSIVRGVDHFLQRKLGVGLPSEWLERAGLKEPAKKAPQRTQERSERQHDELDGPSF
jgi:hypothetical protein